MEKEAFRRTAVSRAYYSIFKLADEYLKKNYSSIYHTFGGGGSHQKVWNMYDRCSPIDQMGISDKGFRLLDLRKKADYIENETISKSDVKLANREAEKIINRLDGSSHIKS